MFICLIILIIIATVIGFQILYVQQKSDSDLLELPYKSDLPSYFDSWFTVSRSGWNAKKANGKIPLLHHPVDLVIVAHTATHSCTTLKHCSEMVQGIQNYHLQQGLADIAYNFLIGGDGNVYVGRGWDLTNSIRNQSVSVSFIGNFLNDELSDNMIDAIDDLLVEGVNREKLSEEYRIVCHNQTAPTLSPGVNVFKIVKKWFHYIPDSM